MIRLRAAAHRCFFQLDEISDVHIFAELYGLAKTCERSNRSSIADPRILRNDIGQYIHAIANRTIPQDAAGSVITDDVDADALALGRGRQVNKPGWAKKRRERNRAKDGEPRK